MLSPMVRSIEEISDFRLWSLRESGTCPGDRVTCGTTLSDPHTKRVNWFAALWPHLSGRLHGRNHQRQCSRVETCRNLDHVRAQNRDPQPLFLVLAMEGVGRANLIEEGYAGLHLFEAAAALIPVFDMIGKECRAVCHQEGATGTVASDIDQEVVVVRGTGDAMFLCAPPPPLTLPLAEVHVVELGDDDQVVRDNRRESESGHGCPDGCRTKEQ